VDDSELVPLDDADWEADLAAWQAESESERAAVANHELDETGIRHGEPCSLRWIYVHMIEEYARHNGHADLIRELIDGAVGLVTLVCPAAGDRPATPIELAERQARGARCSTHRCRGNG